MVNCFVKIGLLLSILLHLLIAIKYTGSDQGKEGTLGKNMHEKKDMLS